MTKIAPGEIFPISVKLSNFGEGKRVDVFIVYSIFNNTGQEIYSASETVAVETTANFVKTVQIPFDTPPGVYTAKTSITYQGQLVPAITEFPFTVQRKILGIFQTDFYRYAGIVLLVGMLMFAVGNFLIKRHRATRFTPFDYSDIPRDKRPFYEILSDTIMTMRGRVGDKALRIASQIDGLKIDSETGRIIAISGSPSKVVALLVARYEQTLDAKMPFSFRPEKTDI